MKVYKTKWKDKIRTCTNIKCAGCAKTFPLPVYRIKDPLTPRYCSRECSSKARITSVMTPCAYCKKATSKQQSLLKVSKQNFCSRKCKEEAQTIDVGMIMLPHYGTGQARYRARAFKKYGKKCKKCSYSKEPRMLDVDHIDSNRENNQIDNLQVLCVWCHAIKTRGLSD